MVCPKSVCNLQILPHATIVFCSFMFFDKKIFMAMYNNALCSENQKKHDSKFTNLVANLFSLSLKSLLSLIYFPAYVKVPSPSGIGIGHLFLYYSGISGERRKFHLLSILFKISRLDLLTVHF